ncbi:hypothetical protein [Streptosporangium sp. NPDC052375]|uniref:hypothetical protein n=1 Tax=Streptosporangium sp. NPDC052375 TaxID=3366195 RepID=UPI0037D53936
MKISSSKRSLSAGFARKDEKRSLFRLENFHRLERIRDNVVRPAFLVGPRPPVDPDRTETGGPSPTDAGNRVITDYPSPAGKVHAASLGGDIKRDKDDNTMYERLLTGPTRSAPVVHVPCRRRR